MGNIYGDILNRDEYVDKVVSIIENCVDKKTPTTFSIEAEWGQGKTWIISKVEAKLKKLDISREYTAKEYEKAQSDYFIIHYNAWEKDYYEEPLIAILSTIVAELNKQLCVNNILTQVGREVGKEILLQLENVLGAISRKLLCVDMVEISKKTAKTLKKIKDKSKIKLKTQNVNEDIDSDIEQLISILNKLSCQTPIIFVVDELDRCVPTFAIKTLERLHHIFYKVGCSVIILSISKEQLNRSIDKLYGNGSSLHYFKKIIDFRIPLNSGNVDSSGVERKLNEFSKLFNETKMDTRGKELVEKICEKLLPREVDNIIDRAILCHKLVGEDTSNFPSECMIAEIIIQTYWNIAERERNSANISPNNGNRPQTPIGVELKRYFKEISENINLSLDGDGVVGYVTAVVLNYRINQGLLIGDTVELSAKLSDYYEKYKMYFRMVRNP